MEVQIGELQGKIKSAEESVVKGSDYRLSMAQSRMVTLQQEIDSLKTVVDMRTAEVHELRAERVRLEEKLELFDMTQASFKKLSAQVEDLKEQLVARADAEMVLQDENRKLHSLVMRENCEKKRLSMENEQLSWKMRQGLVEGEEEFFITFILNLRRKLCGGDSHGGFWRRKKTCMTFAME